MITEEKEIKIIISNNIKYLISESKKNRKQIANEMGVKYTTFCDWVNGKVMPGYTSLEKMGHYFDIPTTELFGDVKRFKEDQARRIAAYGAKLMEGRILEMDVLNSLSDEQIQNLLSSGFRFRHRSLEEYIEMSGRPLKASEEYDWGEPVGREIW